MSIQTLSALAIRITGIVIGLYAVKSGAIYVYAAKQSNDDPWLFVTLTPIVMMFSASACMIAFPRIIAGKLVPVADGTTKEPPSITDLEVLGSALLGLYFLIQSVLDAVWMISLWFATKQFGYQWQWSGDYVSTIAVAVVEFAIAVWLMLGARGLFELLRRARVARSE